MRVDFNVPLKEGKIKDMTRIIETIPTLKKILDEKPKGIILLSHLGRPDGKINPAFSLKPIVPALEDLLKRKVTFIDNCVGIDAIDKAINLKN